MATRSLTSEITTTAVADGDVVLLPDLSVTDVAYVALVIPDSGTHSFTLRPVTDQDINGVDGDLLLSGAKRHIIIADVSGLNWLARVDTQEAAPITPLTPVVTFDAAPELSNARKLVDSDTVTINKDASGEVSLDTFAATGATGGGTIAGGGTATITSAIATTTSNIQVTCTGATPHAIGVTTKNNGSFVVKGTASDTFDWVIVKP